MIKKTKPTKGTPDSHPMIGGDGANSYTQNSSYQRGVIDGAKGMIFQTIPENIDIHSPPFNPSNAFRIANFGCSTGPNTFVAMQNIIDAVMLKNQSTEQTGPKSTTPEFQVFFNDHVDNDFNTLFKTLPPNRLYFAAGVPGSFHNQLFPRASLHIAHCSYALHWLSRIPPGVTDRGSPAWNKDKIYCAGNKKEVTEAYFGQFQADMDAFLEARAQELVEGGLVVIQIPGVPDRKVLPSDTIPGLDNELLGESLDDMIKMGVISQEQRDSFNVPAYHPSINEMETVVEMNKRFTIAKICTLLHPWITKFVNVEKLITDMRAVMENLLRDHFGSENMDLLFHLFAQKLQKNRLLYESTPRKDVPLFVLLKRKGNF